MSTLAGRRINKSGKLNVGCQFGCYFGPGEASAKRRDERDADKIKGTDADTLNGTDTRKSQKGGRSGAALGVMYSLLCTSSFDSCMNESCTSFPAM